MVLSARSFGPVQLCSNMAGESREVLFEFTAVGAVVKVVAIDAETGIEVAVMGPAHASRADLQKLAVAKLKRRLSTLESR